MKSFIDPLKHRHFFPAVPSGCFSFLQAVSRKTYLLTHRWGSVCVWGGVYMCLCSSVYVMGRGVVGWVWQRKNAWKEFRDAWKVYVSDISWGPPIPVQSGRPQPPPVQPPLLEPPYQDSFMPVLRANRIRPIKSPVVGFCYNHTFASQRWVPLICANFAIGVIENTVSNSLNQTLLIN